MQTPGSLGPQAQAHVAQARRNHSLYLQLRSEDQYLDWALTALFYCALHLVLAHAAQLQEELADDHAAIRRHVDRHLMSIRRAYRHLFDASRDTRYRLWVPSSFELKRYYEGEFGHIRGQLASRGFVLDD